MLASSGEMIPPCGVPVTVRSKRPVSVITPAFRNDRTSTSTRSILDTMSHLTENLGVREPVKARLDVRFDDPLVLRGGVREVDNLGDRVMRPPSGPIAVGRRIEAALKDRLQDELEGHLHDPILDRRDTRGGACCHHAWGSDVHGLAQAGNVAPSTPRAAPAGTAPCRATARHDGTVKESIPAVRDPRLALTRDHATNNVAGSQTRFHKSQNLRSASSDARSCSLRWK